MKKPIKDHLGNDYPSTRKMCEIYGINEKTFYSRIIRDGYSLEEALGVIPRISILTKDLVIDSGLTIVKHVSGKQYFHCIYDNSEAILCYEEIIEYYRKNIFMSQQ